MSLEQLATLPGPWLFALAGLLLGMLVGILLEWLFTRPSINQQMLDNTELRAKLEAQASSAEERSQMLELVQSKLSGEFGDMAQQTMQRNSETFLKLAEEHLGKREQTAKSDLAAREKAVENLVAPIQEALKRSEAQIQAMEKARHQAYGGITEQLASMQQAASGLTQETRNLVTALRRPEVRGQWGEITLKRLVEMAGMVEHCDFIEQASQRDEDGRLIRPDMVIRMPDDRELVVDVKTPLDAYLSAIEAEQPEMRDQLLTQHARKVRERIDELARKSYWSQFEKSPEFVILFIPGDQFLSAAVQKQPSLIDDALRQNIILATPTSFVALLKAVAYGWRQLSLAENAEQIRRLAIDLHDRLGVFSEHLAKVGRQLDGSTKAFNQAVGSLERNVLPGARKFTELGIQPKKTLEPVQPVESAPRELQPSTTPNKPGDLEH
ncbi:MAG: DNA recombination protein RmuC [Pseudomonadota bacterium]